MRVVAQSMDVAFARASSSVRIFFSRPRPACSSRNRWYSSRVFSANSFFCSGLSSELNHTHRARGVQDMHDRVLVGRRDLHRRVRAARRRPADEQRQVKIQPLHFRGNVRHFVQARGDEAAQADDVDPVRFRRVENLLARTHDAQVDDLEVVTRQHDADDVLADVGERRP